MFTIWSLVPLPVLNPVWTPQSSWFTYYWSLAWRIFSITLLACEVSAIVWWFEHSLALPFFGIGMKTDLFQFCDYCWVFQICWYSECSTLTASSFRIWNSSARIPRISSKACCPYLTWAPIPHTVTSLLSPPLNTPTSFSSISWLLYWIKKKERKKEWKGGRDEQREAVRKKALFSFIFSKRGI